MNKQQRADLKAAYLDGTEDSEQMLKLFELVEELAEKVGNIPQGDLFSTEKKP